MKDRGRVARRVEDAIAKRDRGEPLTEREWTVLQYALGGGCHACGGSGSVTIAVRMPQARGEAAGVEVGAEA